MKICEDCIKKDVCKFKNEIENYEIEPGLPEPLEPAIVCKYKRVEPSYHLGDPTVYTQFDNSATLYPEYTTTDPCWETGTVTDSYVTGTYAAGLC